MIKAIFFDIDGTLISMKTHVFTETTIRTLKEAQENGVRLFIASGRPIVQLPLLGEAFNAFPWDGYVMFNGGYVLDSERKPFFSQCFSREDAAQIVPYLKEHQNDMICTVCELESSWELSFNPGMYEYLKSIGQEDRMSPIHDPERIYDHDIYMFCPYVPAECDEEFLSHLPGAKSVRWNPNFADIIPVNSGKPEGIKRMLDRFGFTREESMSFGDGGNDIAMLEYCGIGVAMGNAADNVKIHADYVTKDCEDEGVVYALKHFGIVK